MVYHKVSYAWPTRKPITKLLALTLTSSVKVPSPFTEPNLTTKIAKPNLPNRISQTKLTKSNLPNYTNQIKPRKVELWIVDWVGTIKTAKVLIIFFTQIRLLSYWTWPNCSCSLKRGQVGGTPLVFAFHSSPLSSNVTLRASWWHSSLNRLRKKWGHGGWLMIKIQIFLISCPHCSLWFVYYFILMDDY